MIDRTAFLAERKKGVGGSDVASLLNIGWGCRRRLWYDKRDTPQDFPRETTAAMELGQVLEPWFADRYAGQTKREVVVVGAPMAHPEHPEIRVNIDRAIEDTGGSRGSAPLEIKSCGRAAFYKYKREGLPPDYILQLQHAMLVTGCTWGSFAIGSRDSGDLLWWDVEANETIHHEILAEAPRFWALVENGPAPDALEPDDPRCQRCEWRRTCQGNALIQLDPGGEMPQMESLRPLLSEYDERKALLAQAEELYEETTEELKTTLGDKQAVMVGERKVYFRPQEGRTLYRGKELLEAYRSVVKYIVDEITENSAVTLEGLSKIAPRAESFIDKSRPSRPLRIF